MSFTTDPKHPDLGHGSDATPREQNTTYLVISEEERKRGFQRQVRAHYVHIGALGPRYPLRDLTQEERERYDQSGYVKFEPYPEGSHSSVIGCYWTQQRLDNIGKGCGVRTSMPLAIAETYARDPSFYGSTYCCGCRMHKPVGLAGEFVWDGTDERVGT